MRAGTVGDNTDWAISLDVGGTTTEAGVVNSRGQIIARLKMPTDKHIRGTEIAEHIVGEVRLLLQRSELQKEQIVGICLGVPGVIDKTTNTIISCPNLTTWEKLPLDSWVEERLGIPTFLEKDANQAALGEHWLGAGRDADYLVCLTLGTGIGAGIILNGQLYRGWGGGAGEIGHMILDKDGPLCCCGNRGCWESFASGRAITAKATAAVKQLEEGAESLMVELAGGDAISPEIVFKAARLGDKLAQRIVNEVVEYLGVGVTNIVNIFNPEMIIIGGGIAQAGAQVLAPIRQIVRQRARAFLSETVRIVPAELGESAGMIGGAYLVFQTLGIEVQTPP